MTRNKRDKLWWAAYDQWLTDCLDEWNEKYDTNRVLGVDGSNCIEFSEDGDAYPHGIGGTGHVRQAVTPWSEVAP